DVEINHDRFLTAPNDDTLERFIRLCIDLLVRDIRRHEDEIARAGFRGKFEAISPSHTRPPLHDINDALEFSVMMSAGLSVWMYADRSRPQLVCSGNCVIDRGRAIHAGRLRSIRVELSRLHYSHSVEAPVSFGFVHRLSLPRFDF